MLKTQTTSPCLSVKIPKRLTCCIFKDRTWSILQLSARGCGWRCINRRPYLIRSWLRTPTVWVPTPIVDPMWANNVDPACESREGSHWLNYYATPTFRDNVFTPVLNSIRSWSYIGYIYANIVNIGDILLIYGFPLLRFHHRAFIGPMGLFPKPTFVHDRNRDVLQDTRVIDISSQHKEAPSHSL